MNVQCSDAVLTTFILSFVEFIHSYKFVMYNVSIFRQLPWTDDTLLLYHLLKFYCVPYFIAHLIITILWKQHNMFQSF